MTEDHSLVASRAIDLLRQVVDTKLLKRHPKLRDEINQFLAYPAPTAPLAEAATPELMRVEVPKFVEIVEKHPTMIGIPLYYAEWPTRAPGMNQRQGEKE